MEELKVIFNGLGPNRTYGIKGKIYKDGDVAVVDIDNYVHIVGVSHFGVDATNDNVEKIRKLMESAKNKRIEVAKKMATKLEKEGGNV